MSVPAEKLTPPDGGSARMVLEVGDLVVSPAHGVAEVIDIESRDCGGTAVRFYVLSIADTGIRLGVPIGAVEAVGIRPLMTRKQTESVLDVLRSPSGDVSNVPWSRRNRTYQSLVHSGSPLDVARVMADLARVRLRKDLSFGERKLLDAARRLLVKEVAMARRETEARVERLFERAIGAPVT